MTAFAKLYDLDGIGQVLVTIDGNDDEDDDEGCDDLIRFRIESMNGIDFSMTIAPCDQADLRRIWESIGPTTVLQQVKPLLAARASLAAQA